MEISGFLRKSQKFDWREREKYKLFVKLGVGIDGEDSKREIKK